MLVVDENNNSTTDENNNSEQMGLQGFHVSEDLDIFLYQSEIAHFVQN